MAHGAIETITKILTRTDHNTFYSLDNLPDIVVPLRRDSDCNPGYLKGSACVNKISSFFKIGTPVTEVLTVLRSPPVTPPAEFAVYLSIVFDAALSALFPEDLGAMDIGVDL